MLVERESVCVVVWERRGVVCNALFTLFPYAHTLCPPHYIPSIHTSSPPLHNTGAGKSTLLRLIMGVEQPDQGDVQLGEYNITPAYFEQNQAEALDLNLTVLDTLIQAAPDAKLNDIKALLGKMMFSGAGFDKKVC